MKMRRSTCALLCLRLFIQQCPPQRTGTTTKNSWSAFNEDEKPPRTSSTAMLYLTLTYTPWYVSVSVRAAAAAVRP